MDGKCLDENNQTMVEAIRQYKDGQYIGAYETARNLIENGEVPDFYKESCAWIIYRNTRQMAGKVSQKNMETCSNFFIHSFPKEPNLARSVFLAQAIEYSKINPEFKFLDFCVAFDLSKLRDDDFKGRSVQMPSNQVICYESLAEKLATRIYNVMKAQRSAEIANHLLPFFRLVKERCPLNKYVDMYLGLLYFWKGDPETARGMFVMMLRTAPQWYIWKNMAYVTTDTEEQIAFLCKAASQVDDEKFKGKLHLQLATLLAERDKAHAAQELQLFFDTYQRNKWRICGDAYILRSKLQDTEAAIDVSAFYKTYAEKAEQIVYGDIPQVELTLTRMVMHNGKRRAQMWNSKLKISVELTLSRLGKDARPGDVYLARCTHVGKKHVVLTLTFVRHNSMARSKPLPLQEKEVRCKVSLPQKGGYAFAGKEYFIPEQLRAAHNLHEGQEINATVRQMPDGRWRVVKIQ